MVRVRYTVRVSVKVSVSVSFSIINVYVEHRYLSVLHCISQRNGMAVIQGKSLLIACYRTGRAFPRTWAGDGGDSGRRGPCRHGRYRRRLTLVRSK